MEAIVKTPSETTVITVEPTRITMNGFEYPRTRPRLRTLLHSSLCHPLQRLHEETSITFRTADDMQTFTVDPEYFHTEDSDGRTKSLNMMPRRDRIPELIHQQRMYKKRRQQQKGALNEYMVNFISQLR